MRGFFRPTIAILSLCMALVVLTGTADARIGGSFGSRGGRTYSAPAPTRTAPSPAAPIQRSTTQPSPQTTAPPQSAPFGRPGFFGGGLFGSLAAGFIGAGLFGLLFGHGLFGGLAGFASFFGLMLQIILVVFVARMLWGWWQRRNRPAFAGASYLRDVGSNASMPAGFGGASPAPAGEAVSLDKSDFDAFEHLLGDIQSAYSAEDVGALRRFLTPEMLSYFSEQLAENASRGVVNLVSDVKLLQGDLAEAWREGGTEYATVAMRYALVDRTVERASGRMVAGSADAEEVTELWTFMRVRGGAWLLSAIQQTG
jgi:predicted lipid-binding transport protein (Tim44 family)